MLPKGLWFVQVRGDFTAQTSGHVYFTNGTTSPGAAGVKALAQTASWAACSAADEANTPASRRLLQDASLRPLQRPPEHLGQPRPSRSPSSLSLHGRHRSHILLAQLSPSRPTAAFVRSPASAASLLAEPERAASTLVSIPQKDAAAGGWRNLLQTPQPIGSYTIQNAANPSNCIALDIAVSCQYQGTFHPLMIAPCASSALVFQVLAGAQLSVAGLPSMSSLTVPTTYLTTWCVGRPCAVRSC